MVELYEKTTTQPEVLVHRIIKPLLDRAKTIEMLGMHYINTLRQMILILMIILYALAHCG